MSSATEKRPRQKRSTGFPVLPLPEAVRILKEVTKYGFDHTIPALATHMGHKTHNSGSFRERIAALRDWGLITRRDDMFTMTETARMIAMPTDQAMELQSIRQAFKACRVFYTLYEQTAKGQAISREGLKAQAVHECKVSPGRADKFVDSFVRSTMAAELAELDGEGQVILRNRAEDSEVVEEREHEPGEPSPEQASLITPVAAVPVLQAPTVHQAWPIGGGEIVLTIRTDGALPAASFEKIGEIVEALEKLATSLSAEDADEETEQIESEL